MNHIEIYKAGSRWNLRTVITKSSLGPLAVAALGFPGLKTEGLTELEAKAAAAKLEKSFQKAIEKPGKVKRK